MKLQGGRRFQRIRELGQIGCHAAVFREKS
jgi:hypothetical protein